MKPLWKCVPPPDDYTPHPSAEEILAKQLISGEKFDPDETPAEKKEREKTRLARKRLLAFAQGQRSPIVTPDREDVQNAKQQTLPVNISEKSRKRILLKRNFPSKDKTDKSDKKEGTPYKSDSVDDVNNKEPVKDIEVSEEVDKKPKVDPVLTFAEKLSEIRERVPKINFLKSELFHPAKLNDDLLKISYPNSLPHEPCTQEKSDKSEAGETEGADIGDGKGEVGIEEEEEECIQDEAEYKAELEKFYADLLEQNCQEQNLGEPSELTAVEEGFQAVLKQDLKTTLSWPEFMIQKTTTQPEISFSVNPLKFEFKSKKSQKEGEAKTTSEKKHKKKRSKKKKKKKSRKRKKKDREKEHDKDSKDISASSKTEKSDKKEGEASEDKKEASPKKRKRSSSRRGDSSDDERHSSSRKYKDNSDYSDYERGRSRHRSGHSRSNSRSSDRGSRSRYSKRRRSRSWSDHYRHRSSHQSRSYSRSPRYSRSRSRSYTRSRSRTYSRSYSRSRSRSWSRDRYRSRSRSRSRSPSSSRSFLRSTKPKPTKPNVSKAAGAAKSSTTGPGNRMKEWVRKALKESKATDPSLKTNKTTVPVLPKPKEKISDLIETLQNRKDATQESLGEGKGVVLTQSNTGKTHITGKTVVELDKPKVNSGTKKNATETAAENSDKSKGNVSNQEENGKEEGSDGMMTMDPAELEKYRDLQESARRHVQQQMMQAQGIVPGTVTESTELEASQYSQDQSLNQDSIQMVQYMSSAEAQAEQEQQDSARPTGFIGPIHPGMASQLSEQSQVVVSPQMSLSAEQLGVRVQGMVPSHTLLQVPSELRAGSPATQVVRLPLPGQIGQLAHPQLGLLQVPQGLEIKTSGAPSPSPGPTLSPSTNQLLRLASPVDSTSGLFALPGTQQLISRSPLATSVALTQQAASNSPIFRLPNGMLVQAAPRPAVNPAQASATFASPTGVTASPKLVRVPGGFALVPGGTRMPVATPGLPLIRQAVPAGSLPGTSAFPGAAGMPGMTVLPGMPGVSGLSTIPGMTSVQGIAAVPGVSSVPGMSTLPGMSALPGVRFVNPQLMPRMLPQAMAMGVRPGLPLLGAQQMMIRQQMQMPGVAALLGKPLIKSAESKGRSSPAQ
ncbi:hypothetical protein HOLleu_20182 [Holothuria leucospilota]|uniref:Uncharacterized protein n=1 Tax=Holothuria leucospilota TaxID=206669 RepID=A0A9Q1C1F9_HOLLE|nr:hypothetical protein HOLleu_20182 [Holothuria leucospilota]